MVCLLHAYRPSHYRRIKPTIQHFTAKTGGEKQIIYERLKLLNEYISDLQERQPVDFSVWRYPRPSTRVISAGVQP